ncbi:hypothetical protein LIER_38726 [Lithospermum erythrorhizon]|uniref:non-specific serine/threonine protein kinase n=1 Tax=Lithospermum erythrorhizon TaxID=34254 RepID=A0AAV3Q832_LITER
MAVKKNAWLHTFLPNCFKIEETATMKRIIKEEKKENSIPRLSLTDFSNISNSTISTEDLSISLAGTNLHPFTVQELKVITHSFASCNFLGEGGFGPVHKGFIDDKLRPGLKTQPVAVKLLDLDGGQGHREWLTEVIFLGQLRHSNLVKLIGYCCEEEHRLLVYEYMPRGSLENQLFRRYSVSLPWSTRMKIAVGAAKGLAFLHEADKQVLFRDFKASNILLDSDYTPKLSDFGLAKDGPEGDKTHVSTRVLGTHGYAAPEYIMTGHLTTASDVYSFGVVLLELITGRKSVDKTRPSREKSLTDWARPQLKDPRKLRRIMDPRLEGMYSEAGAQKAAALAYQCLSHRPKARPTMRVVVDTLEPLKDFDESSNGIFVYNVPVKNDELEKQELKENKRAEELIMKKENGYHHQKHKLHQDNIHRIRTPRSPNVHPETSLGQSFTNVLKSPRHQRLKRA